METLSLLENKIGKIHETIGVGKNFLNKTAIAQEMIPRINKWDYNKLKAL